MDPFKKAINVLMLAIGLGIFSMVVILKVEVMAQQSKAEFKILTFEQRWEDHIVQDQIRHNQKQNF